MATQCSHGCHGCHGGNSSGATVTGAARQALKQRLAAVLKRLGAASRKSDQQTENVHQLRVAIRRVISGLRLYQDCLPKRRTAQLIRRLRGLRRKVGTARDLDVLILRYSTADTDHADAAPEHLQVLAILRRRRKKAQRNLRRYHAGSRRNRSLKSDVRKLLKRVRWRGMPAADKPDAVPDFQCWARQCMESERNRFQSQWPEQISDVRQMHQFRIRCKQLRYCLELLEPAIRDDAEIRQLQDQLVSLQDGFGELQDHVVAVKLIQAAAEESTGRAEQEYLTQLQIRESELLERGLLEVSRSWPRTWMLYSSGKVFIESPVDTGGC